MRDKLSIFIIVSISAVAAVIFTFYLNEFILQRLVLTPVPNGECKATGCSGQICAEEDVITTCEFLPEYTCYKTAKCERRKDGKCGWTPTEELVACLGAAFKP